MAATLALILCDEANMGIYYQESYPDIAYFEDCFDAYRNSCEDLPCIMLMREAPDNAPQRIIWNYLTGLYAVEASVTNAVSFSKEVEFRHPSRVLFCSLTKITEDDIALIETLCIEFGLDIFNAETYPETTTEELIAWLRANIGKEVIAR